MDTARQILRFSIPGSIFLLHAAVCYLIYRRIQGVPFVVSSTPIQDNVASVIAVLTTIPVGFVIYQLYYFTYEPVLRIWPLPWGGRYVRNDRGGQILGTLDSEQISRLKEIFDCKIESEEINSVVPSSESLLQRAMHATGMREVTGVKWLSMTRKERQRVYEDLWYTHWDALRSAIDIAASHTGGEHVKAEYTTLSDIYHSLGAAQTAIALAWLSVFALSLSHFGRIEDAPWEALGGVAFTAGLTAVLYVVLHFTRGRTWRTAVSSLTFGLRWLHWRHGIDLGKAR
jgi:hypothetical protein